MLSQQALLDLAEKVRPHDHIAADVLGIDAIDQLRWSENERAGWPSRQCAYECAVEAVQLATRMLRASAPHWVADVEALLVSQNYKCFYCNGTGEHVVFGRLLRPCVVCKGSKSLKRGRVAQIIVDAAAMYRMQGHKDPRVDQFVTALHLAGDYGLVFPWKRALELGPFRCEEVA